jgi:AraC-like DNA-binding protein
MEQLSISTRYIKSMLKFAEYRECDVDELLAYVGTSRALLKEQRYVSVMFYGELYHAIIEQLQDEWFGLLKGGNVRKGSMRFLMRSLVHCKNLEEAIQRSDEFFEICNGYLVKQEITYDGDDAILKLVRLAHVPEAYYQKIINETPRDIIKSTLLALHGINSWLTGNTIPIKEVFYQFSEEQDQSSNPAVAIQYNHEFYGYRIAREHLAHPIVQQEANIEAFIRRAPYFVFLHSKKEGLVQQIKSILAKSLGDAFPTADEMAAMLNMSSQTLFRHLKAEGVNYVQLKNSVRAEMAVHYLMSGELSNEKISELLGFENPSTFYRVFKKWTGVTPGDYRKKLKQNRQ